MQERFEGNFRFRHVSLRASSEPIAILNGSSVELQKLDESFNVLISNQETVVNRTAAVKCKNYLFFLNVSKKKIIYTHFLLFFFSFPVFTNLFSYLGSILSYAIIGIPLFTGVYDDLTEAELSSLISEVHIFVFFKKKKKKKKTY